MALVSSFDSIIFDYGGVLVSHQTEDDQATMAQSLGVAGRSVQRAVLGHTR